MKSRFCAHQVCWFWCVVALTQVPAWAQQPPFDVYPPAEPPYYRIRYEASTKPGELIFPVNYTIWIPPEVETLRGIVVHQHGCGEGSCSSGLSGAYDLHWQALARKHNCALFAPAYEQPQKADCQMWCDPRNGSAKAFQRGLEDLGDLSGHPELGHLPWALWGHSGGGHWAGGMTLLFPERTIASWLRSGVPLLEENPKRPQIKPHDLPETALAVPIMCNPGTQEGVTVTTGKFKGTWPANLAFIEAVRKRDGLLGVAVDPLTSHECGNQRYMAIPWLDACLRARLPDETGKPLKTMPRSDAWLAEIAGFKAWPVHKAPNSETLAWLPNETIAKKWMQYVKDTAVADTTPPPSPTNVHREGNRIVWNCKADLESGLSHFIVKRTGKRITTVPEKPENKFGRPLFQNLLYSDTPTQPLAKMEFMIPKGAPLSGYQIIAVNTVGLESQPARIQPRP